MTRRNLVVDAGIAALVLGISLGVLASQGIGMPDPSNRDLDARGVLLVLASALPLVARRISPMTVYAVVSAASLALLVFDYPLDVPLAPLVALYQVAVAFSGDPLRRWRWTGMAAAAAFVPATAAAYAATGETARPVPDLLIVAAMVAGVWVAGDRTRLRRQRVVELEERAQRAEREADRERRLAAAEERTRIARELHDSAGHAINVILVQAGAARLLHERDPEGSRRAIVTIEELARETVGEIDQLVRALREDDRTEPAPPADPAALEELLERHRASGLALVTDLRGPRPALPRSVAWASYRILQEALTNAARHGRGSAEVAVGFGPGAVEITVTNAVAAGPAGPAVPAVPNGPVREGGGHGIVGMRERATLLGGTLEAGIERGIFRLHAHLPYSEVTSL
ncbi:sensor histidine kinase [Actinopolymorpha alba]|uniref:sensor histidine kinase n=1 Tax=Actinopolymorpha alba TaxID=533267 RepID=UPI000368B805|nr:histidine kinase [Actinopolymorpha alba]